MAKTFDKTVEGLGEMVTRLNKMAADLIPKDKTITTINGKPCEISIGGSGIQVTIMFTNEDDASGIFEQLKNRECQLS